MFRCGEYDTKSRCTTCQGQVARRTLKPVHVVLGFRSSIPTLEVGTNWLDFTPGSIVVTIAAKGS